MHALTRFAETGEGNVKALEGQWQGTSRLRVGDYDAAQCGGRPCIRGMRIRVSDVLGLLGAGASFDEILEDYPCLEREDILAAIEYAARQSDHSVLLSA